MKQDAETRRVYLSNTVGQDMTTNIGRKQRSLDARERLKFVVDAFDFQNRGQFHNGLKRFCFIGFRFDFKSLEPTIILRGLPPVER